MNCQKQKPKKKKFHLPLHQNRIKYLGINLSKEVKGNYKTVLKETEEDPNRWKDILCSWTGSINIIKMMILLKTIHR